MAGTGSCSVLPETDFELTKEELLNSQANWPIIKL